MSRGLEHWHPYGLIDFDTHYEYKNLIWNYKSYIKSYISLISLTRL